MNCNKYIYFQRRDHSLLWFVPKYIELTVIYIKRRRAKLCRCPVALLCRLASLCPPPRVVLVPSFGCTCGGSALHVVVGPFVSLTGLTRCVGGPTCCPRPAALSGGPRIVLGPSCVVGGPHVVSSALRVIGGPYMLSSDPSRCRWALRGVVGPFALLGTLHVVLGPFALSLGPTRRHWAVTCRPWALRGLLADGGPSVVHRPGIWTVMAHFCDAPGGPPISWVPLMFLPPIPPAKQI